MYKKLSLTKRIVYLSLILLPIPLLINLVIITGLSFSSIKEEISKNLQWEANNYMLSFKELLKLNNLYLNQLENILSLKESDADFQEWISSTFKNILKQQAFEYYLVDSENIIISAQENSVHNFLITHPNFLKDLYLKENKNTLILTLDNPENEEKRSFLLDVKKLSLQQKTYYLIKSENVLSIWNEIHKIKSIHENINVILTSAQGEVLASSLATCPPCLAYSKDRSFPYHCVTLSSTKIKFFPHLSSFSLNEKKYFSYVSEDKTIEGFVVVTFSPFQEIIWKTLKSPLEIFLLFLLTFTIGVILIWIIANKMSKPLRNLSLCMQAVKKGNYHARFSPLPFGREFNYLGKKFNNTLTLLLTYTEKIEHEQISRKKLEHELFIIKEIQNQILFPLPLNLSYISNKILHIPGSLIKGVFQEWQEVRFHNKKILRYGIGLSEDFGLTSCLYSITIRSLFLAYSNTLDNLEKVLLSTEHDFFHQDPSNSSSTLSMFAFDYNCLEKELTYCLIGQRITVIKKHENSAILLSSIADFEKKLIKKTISIASGEEFLIISGNCSEQLNDINHFEKLILNFINRENKKTLDSLVSEIKDIYTLNKKNSQEVIITILNFK